jgi:hypothetical protein
MQSRATAALAELLCVSVLFDDELGNGHHDTPFSVDETERLDFS